MTKESFSQGSEEQKGVADAHGEPEGIALEKAGRRMFGNGTSEHGVWQVGVIRGGNGHLATE